jgi:UDP-N-acetylglucosamine 2-epimerase
LKIHSAFGTRREAVKMAPILRLLKQTVETETSPIVREAQRVLDEPAIYTVMARAVNPYGDGHPADRIVNALLTASQRV